jgi:hypothetical protein
MKSWKLYSAVAAGMLAVAAGPETAAAQQPAPAPLAAQGQPVDWLYVFKLNAATAAGGAGVDRPCPFGGTAQPYPRGWGQQYAVATSASPTLKAGPGLAGTSAADPLGATFGQIYNGGYNYVVWNDQFYSAPNIHNCGDACSAPWGHSKGILAWNDSGEGVILQVTTPSWPASGNKAAPRPGNDGNTLGCVEDDNVLVSQGFFALKLSENDVEHVLDALANASVSTDPTNASLVRNGGPAAIQQRVTLLGKLSPSATVLSMTLSSGVRLISKPSKLNVPPWQMVSAILGGVPLRTATWWTRPAIPSTTAATPIACWSPSLAKPGAVEIATTGTWAGRSIGLTGVAATNGNHAKLGVSTAGPHNYAIFGDMNQQGALSGNCKSSQNGRGGLFFVVDNAPLHASVQSLIAGQSDTPTPPAAPAAN